MIILYYLGGLHVIIRVLIRERGMQDGERDVRKTQQIFADLKSEGNHEPLNVGGPQKLEKTRKWFCPGSC